MIQRDVQAMTGWWHCKARIQGGRPYQEDHYGIFLPPKTLGGGDLLLVLADGMGGEYGGERASHLVVRTFIDAYAAIPASTIPQRLQRSLAHANRELALDVASNPALLSGMGCTLLAAVLSPQGLYWISVGDSPLWLWRKGKLTRLNQDHSYRHVLECQVLAGELSQEDANGHPDRTALLSAVTGTPLTLVDVCQAPYALQRDDRILVASDGLLTLDEAEIGAYLAQKSPCQQLLNAVVAAGHPYQDNATAIVAGVNWTRRLNHRRLLSLLLLLLAGWMGGVWWSSYQFGSASNSAISSAPAAQSSQPQETDP